MKKMIFLVVSMFTIIVSSGQITTEQYIDTYKDLAISEMRRTGIPAAITLAQGLLESDRGNSLLASKKFNHFGVKPRNWDGPTFTKKGETFCVYKSAKESYGSHSEFLLRARYTSLFQLDPDDYKGWAYGLKRNGYATDPKYPQKLIKIIEVYDLQQYNDLTLPRIDPPLFMETTGTK